MTEIRGVDLYKNNICYKYSIFKFYFSRRKLRGRLIHVVDLYLSIYGNLLSFRVTVNLSIAISLQTKTNEKQGLHYYDTSKQYIYN
jgi:hypothetical protein